MQIMRGDTRFRVIRNEERAKKRSSGTRGGGEVIVNQAWLTMLVMRMREVLIPQRDGRKGFFTSKERKLEQTGADQECRS